MRFFCLLGMHTTRLSCHHFGPWNWVLRVCTRCPYVDPYHLKGLTK